MDTRLKRISIGVGLFGLFLFSLSGLKPAEAACTISSTNKYAWSENTGWVNFRATHECVAVGTGYLVGYAWSENIGWIKMGSTPSDGSYPNTTSTNWGVNRDGSGNLSGYAWSENVGWINFNPSHSQVTINTGTGDFDGYAWSENVGWIHFQNASPAYKVQHEGALAIELTSFEAAECVDQDCVHITWVTETEVDNVGFHIWRSDPKDGEYAKITDYLIPTEGVAGMGASYAYDDFDVLPGRTYYYKLEDISNDSISTFYGPVSVATEDMGIGLITPRDGAVLPVHPPATFRWEGGGFHRFKLQFSGNSDFTSGVITLRKLTGQGKWPSKGGWITRNTFTPNPWQWKAVTSLGRRGKTVYWRVYGEDKSGNSSVSRANGFTIQTINIDSNLSK